MSEALTTWAVMQALVDVYIAVEAEKLLAFRTRNARSWHVTCIARNRSKIILASNKSIVIIDQVTGNLWRMVSGMGMMVIQQQFCPFHTMEVKFSKHLPGFRRLSLQPKQFFGILLGLLVTDGDTSSKGVIGNK